MTTLDFSARLDAYVATKNCTTLPATAVASLIQSINAAQVEWCKAAPALSREFPATLVFGGSSVVSVGVTDGSATISGLSSSHVGNTIVFPGDSARHKVVSTTKLLMPYLGPTTGTVSATITADGLALPDGFEILAGKVEYHSATGKRELVEVPDTDSAWDRNATGEPTRYAIEHWNYGGSALPVMRVYPYPVERERVTLTYSGKLPRWERSDIRTARTLLLADEEWDQILQIALGRMATVPGLLHAEVDKTALTAERQEAKSDVRNSRQRLGRAPMTIGTPERW